MSNARELGSRMKEYRQLKSSIGDGLTTAIDQLRRLNNARIRRQLKWQKLRSKAKLA